MSMDNEFDDWLDSLPPMTYDVTCARCGKVLSCSDAVAEEGDEWECFPCNDRANEIEKYNAEKYREEHGF